MWSIPVKHRDRTNPSMASTLHILAQVLWVGAAVAAILPAGGALLQPSSNCQRKCGQVHIPYPFGIGSGDSPDHCAMPGFNLSCINIGGGDRPFHGNVEVLSISLQNSTARMRMTMSSYCYNDSTQEMEQNTRQLNLTGTPYRLSDTGNKFTVLGCRTLAYIGDEDNVGNYTSGCVSMCRRGDLSTLTNGSCSGIGCCQTAIPKGLHYYQVWFASGFDTSEINGTNHCSYAALIEASNFSFSTSYATSSAFDDTYGKKPPLVVDWAIRNNRTCEEARNKPESYACVSSNSQCFNSTNGPGYVCSCSKGFQGNPYLVDGCKDIDECNNKANNSCSVHAICKNTQGGYECTCPSQYPKGIAYNGTCEKDQSIPRKVTISIGIFACFFTGLLLFLGKEWFKHKRRIIRQEYVRKMNEYFQQNGGQLLMDMMKVESNISFKLYNREDIELATNNFDNSSIIGEGGQGTVYIGQNLDSQNNPVAIKICKAYDESRRREFGQELLILSRVKHENIVQLLGCSLQFEAPVLVYEYVPNQTLHYLIHNQYEPSIRILEIRLRIAIQISTALAYLHSLSHPIFHGDVKSVNILIDHDLSAKVSDFGCSMIRSSDDNVQVVKGTMGYLDPEYLLNFELTDKSDVYSFGVILLELLTRRTALSKTKENLVFVFTEAVKEGKLTDLIDREIANQENMEVILQVAAVASWCLAMTREHRPMMRQVAEELQRLAGPLPQRTVGVHGVSALMFQGRPSNNASEYSSERSTDYYTLQKKASMSIEFAR